MALYGGFDKLLRRLQKVALRVFGAADSGPRVQAALLIRAMAMLLPAPALDNALKVGSLLRSLCLVPGKHISILGPGGGQHSWKHADAAGSVPNFCFECQVRQPDKPTAYQLHGRMRGGAVRFGRDDSILARLHAHQGAGDAIAERTGLQVRGCLPRRVLLADNQLPGALGSAAGRACRQTGDESFQSKQLSWTSNHVSVHVLGTECCSLPDLGAFFCVQELRPLVYPVVQLLLGAVRLVPSPRYFPLRLRLVRSLNQLSAAAGVYVPVSGVLLEMLRWSDLTKAPKSGATGRAPSTSLQLRIGKATLRTPAFQEETILQARGQHISPPHLPLLHAEVYNLCASLQELFSVYNCVVSWQIMEQLAQHLGQWSCSVAFPELAHLTLVHLRRFVKSTTVERFRAQVCSLAQIPPR